MPQGKVFQTSPRTYSLKPAGHHATVARSATLFGGAIDRPEFLRHATFGDLPKDRIFFKAVSYDTGQRAVLSNGALPGPQMPEKNSALPAQLRALSFSGTGTLRAAPTSLPVSLAVATSAAFPPYLGPMTIENAAAGKSNRYMHLGDGGVFGNSGVETLLEAVYARGPDQSATIFSFNTGMQLDSDLSQNTADISIWSSDVTRLIDVLLEYATAHRETMFSLLHGTNSMMIHHIDFNYMDIVHQAKSDPSFDPRWTAGPAPRPPTRPRAPRLLNTSPKSPQSSRSPPATES